MEQATLAAATRTVVGKQTKRLRRSGLVPGVVYGHGFEPLAVQFEERPLDRLLSHVGGSQLVELVIDDGARSENVLVRDVQRDTLTRSLIHVDLYRVRMTERLRAEVPIVLVGESPVVVSHEGMLLQGISSVEVECLPADLVDSIEIDLSAIMSLDQSLHVGDLPVPDGMDIITDVDEMVAQVVPISLEEEIEEEEEEFVSAEVEVITEARDEELEE
jgi:large subunit ribosomal protein L25